MLWKTEETPVRAAHIKSNRGATELNVRLLAVWKCKNPGSPCGFLAGDASRAFKLMELG